MTRIATGQHIVTLVNVFTVAPDRQQALVDLLVAATEQTMCHQPGYVSANIHRSLDGTKVVNYAQWREPRTSSRCWLTPRRVPTSRRPPSWLDPSLGSTRSSFTHSSS